MRKPSMKQAEWIHKQLGEAFKGTTADDIYDIILGNITQPADLVSEVTHLALEYEDDFRRHNDRLNRSN